MKLPVDTSSIAFLCALEPQPVLAFDTKQPRADENGEPLYVLQLIALSDGAAEIIAVKVPGQPSQAIRQGHPDYEALTNSKHPRHAELTELRNQAYAMANAA